MKRKLLLIFLSCFLAIGSAFAEEKNVRVHFHRADAAYADWKLYPWGRDLAVAKNVSLRNSLLPAGQDDFGIYFDIPMKAKGIRFGFIIHKNGRKHVVKDITFYVKKHGYEAWQISGDSRLYASRPALETDKKEIKKDQPVVQVSEPKKPEALKELKVQKTKKAASSNKKYRELQHKELTLQQKEQGLKQREQALLLQTEKLKELELQQTELALRQKMKEQQLEASAEDLELLIDKQMAVARESLYNKTEQPPVEVKQQEPQLKHAVNITKPAAVNQNMLLIILASIAGLLILAFVVIVMFYKKQK